MRTLLSLITLFILLFTSGSSAQTQPQDCWVELQDLPTLDYSPTVDTRLSLTAHVTCLQDSNVQISLDKGVNEFIQVDGSGLQFQVQGPLEQTWQVRRGMPQSVQWLIRIPAGQWDVLPGTYFYPGKLQFNVIRP